MANAERGAFTPKKLFTARWSLCGLLKASTRFAVLIDGDNVGPKVVPGLFNHIARLGDPTVRRVLCEYRGGGGPSGL